MMLLLKSKLVLYPNDGIQYFKIVQHNNKNKFIRPQFDNITNR